VVEGVNELLIIPLPEISDQEPVPINGRLADIAAVGFEIQIMKLPPALAGVGLSFMVTVRFETEAGQTPLEMLH